MNRLKLRFEIGEGIHNSKGGLEILNLVGSSLTSLERKGNLTYAQELYNPLNFFKAVHHISFDPNDKNIGLQNPTIIVHTLRVVRRRLPPITWIVNALLAILQMLWIARKNKVCLIRGRGPDYASLLGLIASKLLGIPLVVSVGTNQHLMRGLGKKYSILAKIEERIVLRGANRVICPSHHLRNYVTSGFKVPTERTCIIPFRVTSEILSPKYQDSDILTNAGISLDKPIVLCIGRLEKTKQVDVVLESVPAITKRCPDVQIVFIGDGSLRPEMERRAAEVTQRHTVYFLGYQPSAIIKYCLNVATVVCIPMSGFVILEAAAASKPIVAFDIEWHSEFIKDGETGLLIENRSCDKLAEAINRLVKDPRLAIQLGKNARNLLDAEYNPHIVAEREIQELLALVRRNE